MATCGPFLLGLGMASTWHPINYWVSLALMFAGIGTLALVNWRDLERSSSGS